MTRHYPNLPNDNIHDQACHWHVILRSDTVTREDQRAFSLWISQSGAHQRIYDEITLSLESLDNIRHDPDIKMLRMAALKKPEYKKKYMIAAISIAATMILGILTLSGLPSHYPAPDALEEIKTSDMLETAIGERSTIKLADGSLVDLNTNTKIRTHLTAKRRLVILTHGQAIFEVAKDIKRPFVVIAGDQKITAIGTQFEVRTDDKGTSVTLLEGKVLIDEIRIKTKNIKNSPAPVELTPGERFVAPTSSPPIVVKIDFDKVTSWRQGRVDFEDELLADVIDELNRYSKHQVVLGDSSLGELRISGSFKTGSFDNFLAALAVVYPVTIERHSKESILQWEREENAL